MKTTLSTLALVCFLLAGCGTTPQQATFRTYGATQVSVQGALKMWDAYVAQAHPPLAQEQAVKTAYEKWQACMAVVGDAGAVYASAANQDATALNKALAALSTAVSEASAAQADVLDLIQKFSK